MNGPRARLAGLSAWPGRPIMSRMSRIRRLPGLPGVLALLALCLGFSLAEPGFATLRNCWVIADRCAIPLILAAGMSFVVLQGGIDLSVEGTMAASSLTLALLVQNSRSGLDLGMAGLALALLPGAAIGLLNGLLVTRLGVPSFMATLGTWSAALGAAMLLSGGQPPLIRDHTLRALGLGHTAAVPNLALIALAVLALGHVLQHYTRFGRYSMAIGADPALARRCGLPVARCRLIAFTLCGMLAGLAGALASARIGLGHADIGNGQMFATVSALALGGTALTGGRGGVLQAGLGTLMLGVLANGMIFVGVMPELQKAVEGALILGIALLGGWRLRARLRDVP